MTGEKNRYTTTEKLWKLDDETLKTPKHDEMVLWLLNRENVNNIIPSPILNMNNCRMSYFVLDDGTGYPLCDIKDDLINYDCPTEQTKSDIKEIWYELRNEYNNIIPLIIDGSVHTAYINTIKSEVPITAKNGFLVGYTDIEIDWTIGINNPKYIMLSGNYQIQKTYIEVKPIIKSFGETLRQLNTYKHYLHTEEMYLFTTDLRFKEAFESQGIKVLTYPGQ